MNIISPLVAGLTALTPLAQGVLRQVGEAVSFQDVLLKGESTTDAADSSADDDSAVQNELQSWKQEALELLLLAGVDVRDPIALRLSRGGSLEVRSAHPQAAEIEQLLNADPILAGQFASLVQTLAAESGQLDDVSDVLIELR